MTPPPQLIGSYEPPRVRRGDRVFCLYRDADCQITTLHGGPIPWPRCKRVGRAGGSGLWVNETLVAAIRTESAEGLKHWFGVGTHAVWQWRKAFGVERAGSDGSRRAVRGAALLGAAATRRKDWTDEELDAKSATAKRVGLRPVRWAETGWRIEELTLLGTMPDKELALKLGRTWNAVRAARLRKKVPRFNRKS